MKNIPIYLSLLALTIIGCDQMDKKEHPTQRSSQSRESISAEDADNTARNVRDRNTNNLTPFDQSESENDRLITQKIRKSLMADNSLSTNAKNIKIITQNGVVTLRGTVNVEREKEIIGKNANDTFGVTQVDNQIEYLKTK